MTLIVSHTQLDSTAARTIYFLSTWFAYPAMVVGFIGGAALWLINPYETRPRIVGTMLLALGFVGLFCFILGETLITEIR
jgi:hypothetical protein